MKRCRRGLKVSLDPIPGDSSRRIRHSLVRPPPPTKVEAFSSRTWAGGEEIAALCSGNAKKGRILRRFPRRKAHFPKASSSPSSSSPSSSSPSSSSPPPSTFCLWHTSQSPREPGFYACSANVDEARTTSNAAIRVGKRAAIGN